MARYNPFVVDENEEEDRLGSLADSGGYFVPEAEDDGDSGVTEREDNWWMDEEHSQVPGQSGAVNLPVITPDVRPELSRPIAPVGPTGSPTIGGGQDVHQDGGPTYNEQQWYESQGLTPPRPVVQRVGSGIPTPYGPTTGVNIPVGQAPIGNDPVTGDPYYAIENVQGYNAPGGGAAQWPASYGTPITPPSTRTRTIGGSDTTGGATGRPLFRDFQVGNDGKGRTDSGPPGDRNRGAPPPRDTTNAPPRDANTGDTGPLPPDYPGGPERDERGRPRLPRPGGNGPPGGQMPDWYDRLWSMTQENPDFGSVDPSATDQEQSVNDELVRGSMENPRSFSYGDVDAEMPGISSRLDNSAADAAASFLANPSRYDSGLFNQLLETGLGRLDVNQNRDRVNTLRDANRRLGPNSGQLTNEYIDLDAEYGRQRSELLGGLLERAATTQAGDRLASIDAARGVSGDVFGRESSLRSERRGERDFRRSTDVMNEGLRTDRLDRLGRVSGQMFDQGVTRRTEQRGERDFAVNDRLRRLGEMERFGGIDRQLGRDAMDDYFRQFGAETDANEALARLMQAEFANNVSLAHLWANWPGEIDPEDEEGGDPPPPPDENAPPPRRDRHFDPQEPWWDPYDPWNDN